MEVLLVAYPGCCALDLVGPSDVFATASMLAGEPLYQCVIGSLHADQKVPTESGVELVSQAAVLDAARSAHTMLVGGGMGVREAVADVDLVAAIAEAASIVPRVGSICTGAFLLAEAGLLNGLRVTTHWAEAETLASAYPAIKVVPDELYICDEPIITAAGVTAGIDLALALVAADHGGELARQVARRMVVYLHRSGGQSQFSERTEAATVEHPAIAPAIQAVIDNPAASHSVAAMASIANMSERHFARVFRTATATTPARWVERVRVDKARHLLEESTISPTSIAARCGFGSYHTMRQSFQRVMGLSPASYRAAHNAPPVNENNG